MPLGWSPLDLLPGAWVAGLSVALGLALRRWFDPVPRRCWAVFGLVLAVLFAPSLLAGRVQLPLGCLAEVPPFRSLWRGVPLGPPGNLFQGDLVLQIAPWLERVRAAWAAGEWPLWNPLAGAGEPLLGNPQSQALQPLAWLALVFPVARAAGVLCSLRVLVALVFSFLWMRRLGLSEAASLAGSLAFGLSGFLQLWLGWPLSGSASYLPLLLYALALLAQRGDRRDAVLLAAGLFGLLNVGHPETELHVLALVAACGLALLFARPVGQRLVLLRRSLAAGALAAALAAPALLPVLSAVPESGRAAILAARHERLRANGALAVWSDPAVLRQELGGTVSRLLPIAAPNAFGNNRFGRYWGNQNILNDAAGFTGGVVLLAALAGSLAPGAGRRFPLERVMQGAAAVALLVLARPPGMAQAMDALPLFRGSLQFHDRIALVLNLALAYLAACAWERWRREGMDRRAIRTVLAVAAALAALLAWAYLAHPDPADPTALAGLRRASLAVQLGVLVTAAAAVLLLTRRRDRETGLPNGSDASPLPWLMAGLVAAELLFVHLPANPATPARFYYPPLPPIAYVAERLAPGERVSGLGAALRGNTASVFGLADPRSTNPMKPAAVYAVLARIDRFPTRVANVFAAPEDPLWGLLGVRYVMTAPRVRLPPPLRLVLRRGSAWVYERPGALPRLFLPAAASHCPGPSWSECMAGIGDFSAQAAVRGVPGGLAAWAAADPAGSRLDLQEMGSALVRSRLRLAEPRLLASSIYQDGGWRLLRDGRRVPAVLANGPFFAVWLSPGAPGAPGAPDREERLDLVYRPSSFCAGMLLAALALTAALALWVPSPRPSPPSPLS